jgi:hypothetical protein
MENPRRFWGGVENECLKKQKAPVPFLLKTSSIARLDLIPRLHASFPLGQGLAPTTAWRSSTQSYY